MIHTLSIHCLLKQVRGSWTGSVPGPQHASSLPHAFPPPLPSSHTSHTHTHALQIPQPPLPPPPSLPACLRSTRYDEDAGLAQSLGCNGYRLSLEWSRIEPQRGHLDMTAVQRCVCLGEGDKGVCFLGGGHAHVCVLGVVGCVHMCGGRGRGLDCCLDREQRSTARYQLVWQHCANWGAGVRDTQPLSMAACTHASAACSESHC